LEIIFKEQPEKLKDFELSVDNLPAIILFIEFDNDHLDEIKNKINLAKQRLNGLTVDLREAYELAEQNKFWEIRRSAAIAAEGVKDKKKALPFIEDVTVHPMYFSQYLIDLYEIMKKYSVEFSVWGHAGNGNIHIQPFLDLGDQMDIEKLFNIAQEVYQKAISLRGSISGEHNDGLMRTPFLKDEFGEPMIKLFTETKNIFDPQNIFNPHKKIGADLDFIKKHLRQEYEINTGGHST
jgi:FAD/FMN-containing dehydrogenase